MKIYPGNESEKPVMKGVINRRFREDYKIIKYIY